jgi:hypothetical protein
MQDAKGFNPYKFGFGAASDSHNSAAAYRQDNFFGAHGLTDATPEIRLSGRLQAGIDPRTIGPGGLTGVWADENTRASIFEAMQRRNVRRQRSASKSACSAAGTHGGRTGCSGLVKTGYAKGRADGR